MTDAAPARFAVSRGLLLLLLVLITVWLLPWLLDGLTRRLLGATPFDAPWLALHFAAVVTTGCLLAALLVIAASRRAGEPLPPRWTWGAAALTALAFGLAPILKSASGVSSDIILAGLLPVSDAQNYLVGAVHLLSSGQLSEWTTRRPLMPAQLAGILSWSGGDLRLTLLVLAAGCAAAALLVAAALRASYGLAAACAAMASLFAFIFATLGSTMSESFGFTVGGAGFVVLWYSAQARRPIPGLGGIALISLALSARAGAFFTLPMLALWMGWRFAGQDGTLWRRFHWGWSAAALVVGTFGFIETGLLIKTIGAPEQAAFSNFASTLYGLAIGGQPWTRVFVDFPELRTLSEGAQAAAIYRLALDHALQAPWDPVIGVLSRYNDFLFNMGWHKYVPTAVLRGIVTALAVVGVVLAVRHRKEPLASLLLAVLIGTLLSVPFLGDGGSRVFAATHPFSAALVALGAWGVQRRISPALRHALDEPALARAKVLAGLLTVAAFAPLLAIVASPAPVVLEIATDDCPSGEKQLSAFAPPNGVVSICPLGSAACVEGVRAESILRTNIWKADQVTALSRSADPLHITLGLLDERTAFLLTRGAQPLPSRYFTACVRDGDAGWLELSGPPTQRP